MEREYSLRELVNATGETPRNVRYFLTLGILPKPQRVGREGRYTEKHVQLLRRIRRLQAEGHSLDQIRALLDRDERTDRPMSRIGSGATAPSYAIKRSVSSRTPTRVAGQPEGDGFELWRRVSITRDIELHVRGRSARTIYRLARVLRQASGQEIQDLRKEDGRSDGN